jgi:hypothetical protein
MSVSPVRVPADPHPSVRPSQPKHPVPCQHVLTVTATPTRPLLTGATNYTQ